MENQPLTFVMSLIPLGYLADPFVFYLIFLYVPSPFLSAIKFWKQKGYIVYFLLQKMMMKTTTTKRTVDGADVEQVVDKAEL